MKLVPFLLLLAAAFFCGTIRDKLQPATPSPSPPTVQRTPYPDVANAVDPPASTPDPKDQAGRTVSGGVLNGKATSLPQPEYPAAARAVRAAGQVSVQVTVDKTGKVVSASAVSGHPLLRSAAERAARLAEFAPTLLGGQPVKVSGVLTYKFEP